MNLKIYIYQFPKKKEKIMINNENQEPKSYSTEQLVYANMVSIEAIVNILVKKGICTREDILETLKDVKKQQDDYVQKLINNN